MVKIILGIILLLFIVCVIIVCFDSNRFVVKEYTIKSDKLNKDTTFLFVSDIHCKEYGRDNRKLFKTIDAVNADFAVIGGDVMVSKPNRNQQKGINFVNNLSKRLPVYFAYGNHEQRAKLHENRYGNLFRKFKKSVSTDNVTFLDNDNIRVNGVNLIGYTMDENYYIRRIRLEMKPRAVYSLVGDMDESEYNILLAHDPEYFDTYAMTEADLVLSGHFHGGIARLPFVGGVISPRFKLFPDYSGGRYEKNNSVMIVSNGLGMHSIPFRFLNPAQLVVIHLKKD